MALDARELLRKSEKIVGIGPALVDASNSEEAEALTSRVRDEQADLATILARLSDANLDPGALDEISDAMTHLNHNLDLMWVAWSDGMGATDSQTARDQRGPFGLPGVWQYLAAAVRRSEHSDCSAATGDEFG